MNSEVELRVERISKKFGKVEALSEVSFSVRRGEILGLIGPNGAGKTTLFECLAGVLPGDGGAVRNGDRGLSVGDRSSLLFYLPDRALADAIRPLGARFRPGILGWRKRCTRPSRSGPGYRAVAGLPDWHTIQRPA